MGLDLGQRLDDPNSMTLIQTLVGIAIQRKTLDAMAAVALDAASGQAIQDRVNALLQQREAIKAAVVAASPETWLQTASAQDVSAYVDRHRLFGEQNAMQWLANRSNLISPNKPHIATKENCCFEDSPRIANFCMRSGSP